MATPIFVTTGHVSSDNGAKKIACDNMFHIFDAKTASITQMQSYAECVNFVYPRRDPAMMKGIVAFLLLAIVIGCVIGYKQRNDFCDNGFVSAIFGGFFGAFAALVVGLLLAAIAFVVS